jgi:hypothetical protein
MIRWFLFATLMAIKKYFTATSFKAVTEKLGRASLTLGCWFRPSTSSDTAWSPYCGLYCRMRALLDVCAYSISRHPDHTRKWPMPLPLPPPSPIRPEMYIMSPNITLSLSSGKKKKKKKEKEIRKKKKDGQIGNLDNKHI